jgi:hypothetical protein
VRALLRLELGLELGLAGVERVEHGGADERVDRPRRGLRQVFPVDSGAGRRSLVLLRRRLRYRCREASPGEGCGPVEAAPAIPVPCGAAGRRLRPVRRGVRSLCLGGQKLFFEVTGSFHS